MDTLLKTPARLGGGAISPDGHWLAYSSSDRAGPPEVFVRPFANGKLVGNAPWQVSAAGGAHPVWSHGGHQLFYLAPDNRIMVVDYLVQGDSFTSLRPRIWADRQVAPSPYSGAPFGTGAQPFDVSPDGKRIVTWQADEQAKGTKINLHLTMLLNWSMSCAAGCPVLGDDVGSEIPAPSTPQRCSRTVRY